MHNKKYILEKIEEFYKHNSIYDGVEGSICYIAYLDVGERGWILYKDSLLYGVVNKIHTTTVKELEYVNDLIIVKTKNTKLIFREIV